MSPLTKMILCGAALGAFGCGATISAATAYDTAHDIEGHAELANTEYASCDHGDGGTTTCKQVDQELCAIIDKANRLEQLAQEAGYTPTTAPPGTPSFCK